MEGLRPFRSPLFQASMDRSSFDTPELAPLRNPTNHPMNENESKNQRPFRRCLDTWPEGMGIEDNVAPISVPDAWLTTTPELPYPWNGAFLKWQEEFKNQPR
jgi:hypothetical protein